MGWQDAPLAVDDAIASPPLAPQAAGQAAAANDQTGSTATPKTGWQSAPIVGGAAVVDDGSEIQFKDEQAPQSTHKLTDADKAAYVALARSPSSTADDLRKFYADRGLSLGNADAIISARNKGAGINDAITVQLPKPADPSSIHGATLRGASQGASLGFGDELHGVAAGAKAALTGGSFGDAYDNTVDADRGRLAADQDQHPYASLAGNIVGSLALPAGLEKADVTAGMDAVALTAYREARLEGFAADEARTIAQRAVTWRLAKEGAAYGGAYGAGTTNGGPGQRLVGAGTGALEGAVGGAALGAVGEKVAPLLYDSRVAARALPAVPLSDAAQVGQAAERQGIAILPQDVGGRGVIRSTQGVAQSPYGAKVIGEAADRLYDSFSGRVGELAGDAPAPIDAGNIVGQRAADIAARANAAADRTSGAVQDAVATPIDSTGAGQLVQRGVSRFVDDTADRASALYNQVPIAPGRSAITSNTRRALADMTETWKSNPELGAAFRSSRLNRYLDALTPSLRTEPDPIFAGVGGGIPKTVSEGGQLSWEDLSQFRTRVGDMLSDPNLTEKIAPRQLRALYGALSSDMEATAKDAGPQAYARWKRANDFYDGRMKRINDTFSQVLGTRGDATPNEAYAALQAMLKPGASGNPGAFMRIMRSMPQSDADVVRASIVKDARGGRQFDPDTFAKTWGQISDRGKSALLPQAGMRALMDDAAGRAALDTRNPFAGMSGEQIFAKLETMAGSRGDATRFAATMSKLSPDEANAVRSTFINQAGKATPGAQNADGDAFSIARWLTRWNTMTPQAKSALFGHGELRAAMNDLATVADKVKASERLAGHSNTGSILDANKTNLGLWSAAGALLTGHVPVAVALAAPAAYQRLTAEAMTSPRLLRWLTRVPKKADYSGQLEYLSKLQTIAAREPTIASNVLGLRDYLRSALNVVPGRAAAAENVDDSRQEPPDRQRQPDPSK